MFGFPLGELSRQLFVAHLQAALFAFEFAEPGGEIPDLFFQAEVLPWAQMPDDVADQQAQQAGHEPHDEDLEGVGGAVGALDGVLKHGVFFFLIYRTYGRACFSVRASIASITSIAPTFAGMSLRSTSTASFHPDLHPSIPLPPVFGAVIGYRFFLAFRFGGGPGRGKAFRQ